MPRVKQRFIRAINDGTPWGQAIRVKNSTGAEIGALKLVYMSGVAFGNIPEVTIADADTSDVPERTIWVTRNKIKNGGSGFVYPWIIKGGFTGLTAGDMLYMNDAGTPTSNAAAPDKAGIIVGEVLSDKVVLVAPAFARASAGVSKAETITPSGDGSTGTPTKTLVARDSGTTYFFNISANTCVFKLPAPAAGLNFKFVAAVASNNEATKDFAVITSAASVDISGIHTHNGTSSSAVLDTTTEVATRSTLQMDTSTSNAPCTTGDYMEFTCDGSAWYVEWRSLYNNAAVANGHALA